MVVNIMVEQQKSCFIVKDRISTLTHFIAFILAILFSPLLIIKGAMDDRSAYSLFSYMLYSLSLISMYGASSAYHAFNAGEKKNKKLKKIDHTMIAILIAGTYTPLCIDSLKENNGHILLIAVWIIALLLIIFKLFFVYCPKWISSILYILAGWVCLPFLKALYSSFSPSGFALLLCGGLFYTIGGIIYALKLPKLEKNKEFRSHELFHIFIMLGSFFHYLLIFNYVA